MPNSFFDPYVGFVPSGQLVIGQDPTVNWEAIGFGQNGRPNGMGTLTINICSSGNGSFTKMASLQIAAGDLLTIMAANQNAPGNNGADDKTFNFALTEVAVCSGDDSGNTQEARMVIWASQMYLPPPS
jgi:hypothetical protein